MRHTPDSRLLRRLRAAGHGFAPAEPGDEACLRSLAGAGYDIESTAGRHRLIAAPDRLIADDILSRIEAPQDLALIREILVYQSTASTNDLVAKLGQDGAEAGIVIFAEEQEAGRGRLGRVWQSPSGVGLWFSVLLRPHLPLAQWPRLTLWLACALAGGVAAFTGQKPMLKWPNDLFLRGKKLAGILVETSLGEQAFASAGIGVNVNHASFPSPLDETATSLRIETGNPVDRNGLAAAVLQAIDDSYSLAASRFAHILAWAGESDYLRGRHVSVTAHSAASIDGLADGFDEEGALIVRTTSGERLPVRSGEVSQFSAK